MTASEQRAMTEFIPRMNYNGEDCIIIPLRQIVSVEMGTISRFECPRVTITVEAR